MERQTRPFAARCRPAALLLTVSLGCTPLGMLSRSANAQDVSAPDSISMLAGYAWPSRYYGTAGRGFTYSGIYGHTFAPHFSFEVNVNGSTFDTAVPGGTDFYQYGAAVDLVFSSSDRRASFLTPYALVGLGGVYDDFIPQRAAGGAFTIEAGVGLISRPLFENGIRLRLDARWVRDSNEGGHSEYRGIAGIYIPLGQPARPSQVPPPTTNVREVVREVIKEVARPWVDTDGDGVDDEHDKCPNSPPGSKVDSTGCVVPNQTIELKGVTFNLNEAVLTPNAETILDTVVVGFVGQPSLRAEIDGHTDSVGSTRYNAILSQHRAETVRDYLIEHGARPDQVTARGFGKTRLLIDPETNENDRERNRRVELRALDSGVSTP
jgi:OOP family OmpA-OmpF porin